MGISIIKAEGLFVKMPKLGGEPCPIRMSPMVA
jgi:hypothetical protein